MELLIKKGRIIDWCQDFIGDVYIKFGVIQEIGLNLEKDCETIDAKGLAVMPAFVDLHSHFRDPGQTYKEDIQSGSLAAVRGGYTAVNLMANTTPVCSEMETVNYVLEKARATKLVDIHQCVSVTKDLEGKDIGHLDRIDGQVKMLSEDGRGVTDSRLMLEAMSKAKEKGLTIITHAESEEFTNIDTRVAENTMTWRDIALAKFTGCKLHVAHVSTKEALKYVKAAKKEGQDITCEVTPHHLALTKETEYRVNPPLREEEDIAALIEGIKEGYVDAIATDHAPHSREDKLKGANGISGIETAFSVCYTKLVKEGHISIKKLSELMSKNPAELMKLNGGEIKPGCKGDIVIVNLEQHYRINAKEFVSKGKNTPFEGKEVTGVICKTIKSGQVVYDNKKGRY